MLPSRSESLVHGSVWSGFHYDTDLNETTVLHGVASVMEQRGGVDRVTLGSSVLV